MKPRTTVKVFSWTFMVMGLLGILGAFLSSSFEEPNWPVPLALVALSMAGFCFLAFLDRSDPN